MACPGHTCTTPYGGDSCFDQPTISLLSGFLGHNPRIIMPLLYQGAQSIQNFFCHHLIFEALVCLFVKICLFWMPLTAADIFIIDAFLCSNPLIDTRCFVSHQYSSIAAFSHGCVSSGFFNLHSSEGQFIYDLTMTLSLLIK